MSNPEQQPPNNEKGSDAGAGCIGSQEFRQNHTAPRAPMPHELTAEWTVSAQLKFARAGETVKKEFSTNDPINPVRVLYKWSTIDGTTAATAGEEDKLSDLLKRNSSKSSARSQDPMKKPNPTDYQKAESFRSTTSSMTCGGDIGGGDSAFSGSNTSNKQKPGSLIMEVKDSVADFYGTRCRSTCNIIVTAVADFLSPTDMQQVAESESVENPEKPFVFNTTASYTVQPEKFYDQAISGSEIGGKHLNFRDAVCQTSDTEIKYFVQHVRKRSPLERRGSQRSYDYRRATVDDLLQQPGFKGRVSEDNSNMPSYYPSPIQTSKSSSLPRVKGSKVGEGKSSPTETQKKPRTVHIDVYCTGSEDDDQADAESSSDSEDERIERLDQESNSTFQTVLENEQMRLRHQRITGPSLPRRLLESNVSECPNLLTENCKNINIGHSITKSSTAEEIHESKQILFRKHVGDQRAVKLQNLRQKYLRQSSDDTLSLGYPNSSRSTVRDNTCSSISSALAGHEVAEADEKDEDLSYSLTKSDSFEYENALDRLRIRQMERLWSRSHSNEDELKSNQPASSNLQSISEVTTGQRKSPSISVVPQQDTLTSETDYSSYYSNDKFHRSSPVPPNACVDVTDYKFQQTSHFPRNKPGFLQFFGPHLDHKAQLHNENILSPQPQSVPILPSTDSSLLYPNYGITGLQRWKSETRDNLSASGTPVLTPSDLSRQTSPQPILPSQMQTAYNLNFQRCGSEAPPSTTSSTTFPVTTPTPSRRFDMLNRPSPAISETSSQTLVGYSSEYLDKAKMFGKVVAARKPGHHVGPTKNPNCSCESCQRWLAERFQIRGRVFSLGEMPVLKRPS